MNKIYKYHNYLYTALRIFIGLDIIYRCKDNIGSLLIYLMLYLIIIVNDHIRWRYLYKNIRNFYISVLLSMIISLIVDISVGGYINIYSFVILYELIIYTEGKISRAFISLEITAYIGLILFRIWSVIDGGLLEFLQEDILDIFMILLGLFFYCLTLFATKALRKEKKEVERLNKELELSYNKLKEQSEKLEELTITKERNRVAGEVHDNLGHSLVALNMNLDVAEKILDKDITKAKELIIKSQSLTKESMDDLRKAVYALKEGRPRTLMDSIRKITDDIESTGKVKTCLKIQEKAEELSHEYKDIIYFSIKEALTNSIKHGDADKINIDIRLNDIEVRINIGDNGSGCDTLVKGNGLKGLESRIKNFGGNVNYNFDNRIGFEIELILPLDCY